MHFDLSTFLGTAVPLAFGLVTVIIKAFNSPSKDQHEAQSAALQQALGIVAQLTAAAAQSVKTDEAK
jgi:hypothetical protein